MLLLQEMDGPVLQSLACLKWLLLLLMAFVVDDDGDVLSACSDERPAAVVQSQLQAAILQRTHALMAEYIPLPLSWDQLWQQADTQQPLQGSAMDTGSCTAAVTVAGLLRVLDTAVYDAEAQVLLSVMLAAAADSTDDGLPQFDGVLAEVEAAVQPLQGFFGRQHLAALYDFTGPAGVQQLIAGVLDKLEHEQVGVLSAGLECVRIYCFHHWLCQARLCSACKDGSDQCGLPVQMICSMNNQQTSLTMPCSTLYALSCRCCC
jgi:hypothetical protein